MRKLVLALSLDKDLLGGNDMNCEYCGRQLEEGSTYCVYCGNKLNAPNMQMERATAFEMPETRKDGIFDNMDQMKPNQTSKKPGKKGSKKLLILPMVLIPILLGVLLLIGGIIFAAVSMFPLRVTYSVDEKATVTKDCNFEDFEVGIKANQPITSVQYALKTIDTVDLEYLEGSCEGGMLKKSLTIDSLNVPPGEAELKVQVKTLFGKDEHTITLKSDMGYTSAPDPNAFVQVADGTYVVSNELLVSFKSDASEKEIEELIQSYGGEVVGELYLMNQYQIRFTGSGKDYIAGLKDKLATEGIVEAVSYNMAEDVTIDLVPNDSEYNEWDEQSPSGKNWGLECIEAPAAWEYQADMSTVKLGVVDSSLQYNHEDLQIDENRAWILATDDFPTIKAFQEYYETNRSTHRCVSTSCYFCSQKDHGTHVTGTIGALTNNGKGVAGVNMNAEMYFSTFWYYDLLDDGQLSMRSTTSGWMYSVARMVMSGCRAVNISVGSSAPTAPGTFGEAEDAQRFDQLMASLEENGYDFLIMKSAGNSNDDASKYRLNRIMKTGEHAKAHTVIVGAIANAVSSGNRDSSWTKDTKKNYNKANYSNFGAYVDVGAPGSDIYSTVSGNGYAYMSGTSMATPMTCGVAGLVYSVNPNLTYSEVKTILCETGKDFWLNNGTLTPVVNAKNAVEWAKNKVGETPKLEKPKVGFVTGIIQDAETLKLIPNAAVLLTNTQTNESYDAVIENGTYYCYLAPGNYNIQFAAQNYVTETVYNVKIEENLVNYNVLLNLVPSRQQNGTATGRIVDAFDASSIPNATLKVYKGINQKTGNPVATTRSDASGNYRLSLAPGNYSICASADGYTSSTTTITILSGTVKGEQDCTMTPILKSGEIRVILTWGRYPADLDSHMVGPAPGGGSFHTYYSAMNYNYGGVNYDKLDVDDTTSFGPETTSVYQGVNGTYTFYVHDFTNRGSSNSSAMSTSGAQVKVYVAGREDPYVFNVPNQPGTLWKVCTIQNGQVRVVNQMSYHADPRTVGQ